MEFKLKPTPSFTIDHAGTHWAVYNQTFQKGNNVYKHKCVAYILCVLSA